MIFYQRIMNKKGVFFIMDRSDRIVSILYNKNRLLHPAPTHFVQGYQYPKRWNILRIE